jgi:hypothetical protein
MISFIYLALITLTCAAIGALASAALITLLFLALWAQDYTCNAIKRSFWGDKKNG